MSFSHNEPRLSYKGLRITIQKLLRIWSMFAIVVKNTVMVSSVVSLQCLYGIQNSQETWFSPHRRRLSALLVVLQTHSTLEHVSHVRSHSLWIPHPHAPFPLPLLHPSPPPPLYDQSTAAAT